MLFNKPPHINAEKDEIAKIVLMPGDPLRAKFIAEKYLTDYKLVTEVRNMLGYTGYYKGKRITVMGSGMGMASIGIYSYELFKIYDVDTIIRIGSCGSHDEKFTIGDTVIADKCYSKTNFDDTMFGDRTNVVYAFNDINTALKTAATNSNVEIKNCNVTTLDVFDLYADNLSEENLSIVEMEAYALFKMARHLNKKCGCLLTVVDDIHKKMGISSEEREKNLNDMIVVALESTLLL